MTPQGQAAPPAKPVRRRLSIALILAGLTIIVAVASIVAVQYLRSRAQHVLVLSSPYIAHIQIGPAHCLDSQRRCPEAAAWPVVSDRTTSGFVVGDSLSTTSGSWFEPGGGAPRPVTRYSYEWERCRREQGACVPIDGAHQPTYTLVPGDIGVAMRAVVTAHGAGGSTAQPSANTPVIGGPGDNSACTFGLTSAAPLPAGRLMANGDRVVRATPSADGLLSALSTYFRPGAGGARSLRGVIYADRNGAPGALLGLSDQFVTTPARTEGWYTLSIPTSLRLMASVPYWIGLRSDLGSPPSLAGAQAGAAGSGSNALSPICGIQAPPGSPISTISPSIADTTTPGAWAAGDRLLATSGAWSPPALAYSYQWQRCDSAGTSCTDIPGATASTYVLAADQLGGPVRVVVTATNGMGSGSTSSAVSRAAPHQVSRTPDGPAPPSGGWSVAYADAFGAPLGTGPGQDNTVWPSRIDGKCTNNPGFNSNEMEVFNCSQATVDRNGLELTCTYAPHIVSGKNYNCGTVTTGVPPSQLPLSGYKLFRFMPGHGREWAIQITARFPPNTGEADPGWWLKDPGWTWELDMLEGFGASAGSGGSWCHPAGGSQWIGVTDPTWLYHTAGRAAIAGDQMLCRDAQPSPFDPSAGYHTYTTVIYPNNTLSEYIDGHIQVWDYVPTGGSARVDGGTVIGPPGALPKTLGGLVISYALRDTATGNPDPHFTAGARTFSVRSITVYASGSAGAADAVNAGLIAPGTRLSP